jgi:three-Cys-motif partner protein
MPRDVGEWSKNKLKILSDYLPVYLQATTRAIERIYIDGFAGPGLNRVKSSGEEIPGSPLVALDAKSKNGTRFDRLYFIERDTIGIELRNLSQSLRERRLVIEGDVNTELQAHSWTPKRSPHSSS